jgi:hypothetical protein
VIGDNRYNPDDRKDSQWEGVSGVDPEQDGGAHDEGHNDDVLALSDPDFTSLRYKVFM